MYKLITDNNNITCIDKNLIDQSLSNLINEENKKMSIEEEKAREKSQNLLLRFSIFDEIKFINAKKFDLVSNLKRAVMNEFGLSDIKEHNIRIRSINISISQKLEPLKEEWKVI